jgi:PilZ domain
MVNRRQSLRRLLIRPPVIVSLGKSKSDLSFDLSEGGLSVYGYVPPSGKGGFQIEFHLPGDFDSIKTRGEIFWASKSRNLTGVRFIGLSDKSQLQLRN